MFQSLNERSCIIEAKVYRMDTNMDIPMLRIQ